MIDTLTHLIERVSTKAAGESVNPSDLSDVVAPGQRIDRGEVFGPVGVDYHVPFGGSRKSSYGGREQGFVALKFYTQMKTVYIGG